MTPISLEAITSAVGSLSDYDATEIATHLTRAGSEFQSEVRDRSGSTTAIAIVREPPYRIVSWTATHRWQGLQTIEGFTRATHRRRGLFRCGVSLLVSCGALTPAEPVAVFNPACISIARFAGFRDVRLYERRDGEWRRNS